MVWETVPVSVPPPFSALFQCSSHQTRTEVPYQGRYHQFICYPPWTRGHQQAPEYNVEREVQSSGDRSWVVKRAICSKLETPAMVYVLRGCFQHTACRRKQESMERKKIGLEQGGIRGKRVALGQALNRHDTSWRPRGIRSGGLSFSRSFLPLSCHPESILSLAYV